MEFDICLVKSQLISNFNVKKMYDENELLRVIQEKKYDSELDDATSVIFDICTIFEKTKAIKFLVQGFGDNLWPVDCRYDLSDIIEDIHYYISNRITSNNYDFQLRFDEQGVQRYIDVRDMGEEVELICHSYSEWRPVPESLQMKKDEFGRMIIILYNNFILFALELCPLLLSNPMLSDWKLIESDF